MGELEEIMERARLNLVKTDAEVDKWEGQIDEIHKACDEVKKAVAATADDPEQLVFSFMPYHLARVSPFFPMNRRDLGNRQYQELSWENSWGTMKVSGIKLSLYDETVLFAILKMVMDSKTRTIKTTRYELCNVMGIGRDSRVYKAIMASIERLTGTVIKLTVKGKMAMVNTILSGAVFEKNEKDLVITVNEYFLNMYAQNLVTEIDIPFRNSLSGDFAKALYRFLKSQKGTEFSCHLLTLARAINVDLNLETRDIKKRIKSGLSDLKKKGFLEKFMIQKNDMVFTWKKCKKSLTLY